MNNRVSTLLATVLVGLSLSACSKQQGMDTARQLDQDKAMSELRQKVVAAYRSGDAAQLAQLFTDNAVLIPSAGQEIKGRQNIEQTFRTLWQNWKVVDFNLVPQEGKTTGDWAFERGTITVQTAKLNPTPGNETRPAAARGQEQNKPGSESNGTQARAGASTNTNPSDRVVMDLNYYVMVLNKVKNDWRINWFVSTNPPEYVETVTSDQQQRGTSSRERRSNAPTRSQRSTE